MMSRREQSIYLQRLATLLKNDLLPVQSEIAREIEEDQPFVSKAECGMLRRVTDRVVKLYEYASSRVDAEARAKVASASADVEAEGGSSTSPVIDAIRADAIKDLNAYLDDGYDPRLIVEQLVVLRRAQRLRRPGRHRGEERRKGA